MRMTTLLKKLLGIQHLLVTGFAVEEGALVMEVRPSWRRPRCSGCEQRRGRYDTLAPRRWRHLDFGGGRVYLRYGLRRVSCRACGVVAEAVPWCDVTTARFTTRFEDAVGFLVPRCDTTSVQEMFDSAWVTVGQIVERVMQRQRPADPLDGLMAIGIDELSYRKGHKYVTTVTDQLSGRIVWAADGKNAETLTAFFDALGAERRAAIEVVTMDMSEAYITVVQQTVAHAQIVFDRFHVQKLVNEALDETRREEWRRLRGGDKAEAKTVKGLRWPLLNPPLEPDAHAGPPPVNAAAGQQQAVSGLSAQGHVRRHPGPTPAPCGHSPAHRLAELGESQSSPEIRPSTPGQAGKVTHMNFRRAGSIEQRWLYAGLEPGRPRAVLRWLGRPQGPCVRDRAHVQAGCGDQLV